MNAPLILPAPVVRTSLIGLDTSQVPVRLVVTLLDDDLRTSPDPILMEEYTFHCLREFVEAWTDCISEWEACIAIPQSGPDPLGIRDWLKIQGHILERYEWMDYRAHLDGDFSLAGIPHEFRRPYVLALYAAYRRQAGPLARGILAKLFEVHYLMEDTRREMHRLTVALSVQMLEPGPPELSIDDIPF
jgi:hypothetical protein